MIRQLTQRLTEKIVAFNAAGDIYNQTLADGKPERITTTSDFEFDPSLAPMAKR